MPGDDAGAWAGIAIPAQAPAGRFGRGGKKPGKEKAIHWNRTPVRDSVQSMGIPADRLPDDTLLAGFGAADANLSLAFVRRFQRIVFGVALTVIGDPATAEDVAQQTFERAWRHAQVYDSRRGSVRAWVTTIAHNLAVDVVRARTSAPVDPQELPALLTAMTDTPERLAVAHDSAAGLRRALRALPAGAGPCRGDGRDLRHDGAADRRGGGYPVGHGEDSYQGRHGEAALGLPPGGCRR